MTDAELIEDIDGADGDLSGKDLEFIEGQVNRLAERGADGFSLSERQRKWAQDIWDRL